MRDHLTLIWRTGVAACQAERVLPPHLPPPPLGRTFVLAIGKAAAAMARTAEKHFHGDVSGLAVMPQGIEAELQRIEPAHAAHPVPDGSSIAAAERLLALARQAGADDLVLVLLSGGASALACLPGEGLGLAGKRDVTEALLRSGAPISEINCVRRHLSGIKGGRLGLAAAPARLLALAISDVAGDRPEDIGSGPTVPDPTTVAEAKAILGRRGIAAPVAGWSETPKQAGGEFRIVARAADALAAAAAQARRLGYAPQVLGECYGDAFATGAEHGALALAAPPGSALISGGELSTPVYGAGGLGGRSHVYALAAAGRLRGRKHICGLAADTDGLDGNSGAAGAFFGGIGGARGESAEALETGDTGRYFAAMGAQFVTGPTDTNVNDLRIILVGDGRSSPSRDAPGLAKGDSYK